MCRSVCWPGRVCSIRWSVSVAPVCSRPTPLRNHGHYLVPWQAKKKKKSVGRGRRRSRGSLVFIREKMFSKKKISKCCRRLRLNSTGAVEFGCNKGSRRRQDGKIKREQKRTKRRNMESLFYRVPSLTGSSNELQHRGRHTHSPRQEQQSVDSLWYGEWCAHPTGGCECLIKHNLFFFFFFFFFLRFLSFIFSPLWVSAAVSNYKLDALRSVYEKINA